MIVSYRTNASVSHFILKITSGEISAKEVAGESGGWANKQQRASQVRIHQGSQRINTTSITSEVLFKNQR
jgi:hypothetical protein